MFEQVAKFFHREDEAVAELSLLKQKLGKERTVSVVRNNVDVETHDELSTNTSMSGLSYWKETLGERRDFCSPEPHIVYSLSQSETVMQPGSAELFQTCRNHPLDELEARRLRHANDFSAAKFLRRAKLERESA